MTDSALTFVPPRRLGSLLQQNRLQRARSVETVAQGTRFSPSELADIESGRRILADDEIDAVVAAYGLEPGEVVPERAELVIDLREHRLLAGGEERTLAGRAPTADQVLASYLSLVYTLRHTRPGTPLVLREADLSVLSRALDLARPEVETRLHELMAEPDGEVSRRAGLLRGKVLLPLAGIVVAATAVGALLLVQGDDETQPAPPPAAEVVPPVGEVELGPSTVQTPDGGQVITGNDLPASEIPPDAVGLAPAQAAEQDPDGSVTQYTVPGDEGTTTTTG